MRKVKISFTREKSGDLHKLNSGVITSLTGNATFPTLPIPLATMTTMNAALKTAMDDAVTRDRQKLAILRQEKLDVTDMLRITAQYVNITVTDGDEAKLLSSGFPLTKERQPRGLPEVVVNLKAYYTNIPGKIRLRWDKSKFAMSYNVMISNDGGLQWTLFKAVFSTRLMCEQLISGTRYHFKVIAVNQNGNAPESDVASQLAA